MAPQIKGVGAFNPAANKKKHNQKVPQTRTPKEKRERIWGKTPQKPYVSSSLGDMARVMMRLMCMENTYFYNPEPPEVEYYDFWQKFSADLENVKDPEDFVDLNRISIANFKKNTSSFDFFGKFTAAIRDRHDMEAGGEQKEKKLTVEAQKLSDIWKDVRISMSSESFISSSTKISEPASVVQMETGWDEECSEDYQSSESDYGFDVQDKCRHHRHKYHWTAADDAHDEYKPSSLEFHTPQGLIEKQANAIAQSILALQKKDNKILYDLATQPRDMDLIDHFADDIDDSFLADSYSYSELPDNAFGPDFDFLNEDLIYKKGRKAKKGQQQVGAKTGSGETDDAIEDDEDEAADEDNKKGESGSSGSECENDSDNECQTKVKSKIPSKRPSQQVPRASSQRKTEDSEDIPEIGRYDACMRRRRKRIEDSLRAAVRRRSPMGSYRPKKGEEPLSKALTSNLPGPAAYNPQITATKPNIHTALLMPRWTKNIYETPGPGPAKYYANPKCTCEMLNLHEAPRFTEDETIGPGPADVNLAQYEGTATDKPKAIIISRKNKIDASVGGRFTNCQNMTRFGPANPPKPLILSRRYPRDRSEPGPGKYDPKDLNDTRLGITVKSRIPPIGQQESPGFLELPDTMGDGPAFSFGLKNFMVMTDQSPGPIYQINKARPKPVSLTFRPFPMRGHESDPSPIEWGTKPAEDKIKNLPRAPCAIIHGNHDTLKGKFKTPGPNKYFIEDCPCVEPGASFKGRYKQKIEVTPGPANYTPKYAYELPPRAVFQGRHKEKVKKLHDPGFITMKPDRIVGGLMTPRWRDREEEVVVPEMTNIFGLTNRGHKSGIPITFKSRHTPFKYSHMAEPPSAEHGGSDGQC